MKHPLPENVELREDNDHSLLLKRTDGIVELRCADVVIYSAEKVKQNHETLRRMAGDKKVVVLTIAGYYTHVLPEARKYTAQGPHRDFVAAEAFLITSFPQWVIAFLFLKVNRPIVPANAFLQRNKHKAEAWLKKFNR